MESLGKVKCLGGTGGEEKGNFSAMIDDDLPEKRHGSLCGTNTERSQTCEGECEHLSFTPMDHHKAINTHHSAQEHAQTQIDFYRSETRGTLVGPKYMWSFKTYVLNKWGRKIVYLYMYSMD